MSNIRNELFEEYVNNLPSSKMDAGRVWSAAIGLQDINNLKTSDFLYTAAKKNIDEEITIDEVGELLDRYYESGQASSDQATWEADKVSWRIVKLLTDNAFVFSPAQYISIHKELFRDIYPDAGKIRDYDIKENEWVLDGDSVTYCNVLELRETLKQDILQEREYRYNELSMNEVIRHLAFFISRLWQIRVFEKGNTRTTAVYFIKYLRHLGYDPEIGIFAWDSQYFRNALVRANYSNINTGIYETTEYLELFLQKLLLKTGNKLYNREMLISSMLSQTQDDDPIKESANDLSSVPECTEREKKILELLKKDPTLTRAKMADILKCSDSTIKRALADMIRKNIIRRIGARKKGEWIIISS